MKSEERKFNSTFNTQHSTLRNAQQFNIQHLNMKKPHYFYKIDAATKVGEALQDFMNRCKEAEVIAQKWAEKQGAQHYYESAYGMAGGVGALEFEGTKEKEGWEKLYATDGRRLFIPKEGTALEKEMSELPVVSENELVHILNLVPNKTAGGVPFPFTFGNTTPIVFRHHEYWYCDIPYVSADVTVKIIDEKEFNRRKMAAINEQK